MRVARIAGLVLAGAWVIATAGALAQEQYPNKVVRIATSEPGSTNDLVARMVARGLSGVLGQQAIVENRGGISPQHIARSAPDGYNILFFGSPAWITPLFRKLPYDPQRDLAAITTGCWQPTVLVVHPSLPVKSVREFIALARSRPGDINFGVGATIASPTLAMQLFTSATRINLVRINYRGTGPAVNALVAGEVQVMFSGAGSVMSHVASGRLRALAVTTAQPTPLTPGLPTVAASGLPGFEYNSIIGFLAPAKTPPAIVNLLSQEIGKILLRPDIKDTLFQQGVEPMATTPEDFTARIKADMDLWRRIMKENNIVQVE